jgi:hypothetical protein
VEHLGPLALSVSKGERHVRSRRRRVGTLVRSWFP